MKRKIQSQKTENTYYMAEHAIYVLNKKGELVTKVLPPESKSYQTSDIVLGFRDLYYNEDELTVFIMKRDYELYRSRLDEATFEFIDDWIYSR
jgi:hypothetical protein